MNEPARGGAEADAVSDAVDDARQWHPFPDGRFETRIGELHFESGYPNVTSVEALFDELDFQRACQAYLWALPIVSLAQLQHALREVLGATDCDLIQTHDHRSKLGLLGAEAAMPSLASLPSMARTGPIVVEVPSGPIVGQVNDFWQRPLVDLGLSGRDAGKGGKYLFVGPHQPMPAANGFIVTRSPTNNLLVSIQTLAAEAAECQPLLDRVRVYPYARRRNAPPRRVHDAGSQRWFGMPPRGIVYWERLHAILQDEPIEERDRFFTAMLKPLGLEKGKPFLPGDVEKELMTEAVLVGEAMARANDYEKRFDGVRLWSGRHWETAMSFDPAQRAEHTELLDERAAWFYESVGSSTGLRTNTPGTGQVYLAAYKDRSGRWLNGGQQYRLVVPAYVPAKQLWSITAYDNDTRAVLDNPTGRVGLSSKDELVLGSNGSATLYFGPQAPASGPANWIETLPGRGWFVYLRLYAPTERYFDRSWQLPDIELLG